MARAAEAREPDPVGGLGWHQDLGAARDGVGDDRADRVVDLVARITHQCDDVAGPCATPSVCIEWMKHNSSTTLAWFGNKSETQRPHSPYCLNFQSGFINRRLLAFPNVPNRTPVKSMFLPSLRISSGL